MMMSSKQDFRHQTGLPCKKPRNVHHAKLLRLVLWGLKLKNLYVFISQVGRVDKGDRFKSCFSMEFAGSNPAPGKHFFINLEKLIPSSRAWDELLGVGEPPLSPPLEEGFPLHHLPRPRQVPDQTQSGPPGSGDRFPNIFCSVDL